MDESSFPLVQVGKQTQKRQGLAEGPTEAGVGSRPGWQGGEGTLVAWGRVSRVSSHTKHYLAEGPRPFSPPPPPELLSPALLCSGTRQDLPLCSLSSEPWHRGP